MSVRMGGVRLVVMRGEAAVGGGSGRMRCGGAGMLPLGRVVFAAKLLIPPLALFVVLVCDALLQHKAAEPDRDRESERLKQGPRVFRFPGGGRW